MMRRRIFIKTMGGLALTVVPGFRLFAQSVSRIVIAGGGIVGASLAFHLSGRGAQVTLCEKDRPASGATGKSFAWLNSGFGKTPFNYHLLNALGVLGYRRLQEELGGQLPLQWGGTLFWSGDNDAARNLRSQVKRKQEWGYSTRVIDEQEFHKLEPKVNSGTILAAVFNDQEGSVNPVPATAALLRAASSAGAEIIYPSEVKGLDLRGGRLRAVQTTHGDVQADVFVIAAGVDTPRLAAMAGASVPLIESPGLLVHTKPAPRLMNRILQMPNKAYIKQYTDGRMVVGDNNAPPPGAAHDLRLMGPPHDSPNDSLREIHAKRILGEAEQHLPGVVQAQVEGVTLGWRPLPKDGYPVLGFIESCPNVYVAVTHSGVTLSPIIGQLAAIEILDCVRVDLLGPYRASRFQPNAAPVGGAVKN
jgi:glycine/D-amino acid oxidase-like deaminating enzyme